MMDTRQLTIDDDAAHDVVTICGVQYSGDLFRALGFAEPGTWLRIEERRDGVLTVSSVTPEMERMFDTLTGKGATSGRIVLPESDVK